MLLAGIMKRLDDPLYLYYYLKSRLMKESLFRRYTCLGMQAGLLRPYFILSLDCDTVEDIKVAWDLHQRLLEMGICPVYAVPGELLKQGEMVYRRIADTGAEFINHGYKSHTYYNQVTREYASCFFYDKLLPEQVEKDILDGDLALKEILGIEAKGFRAPHFGTLKGVNQLTEIHGYLKKLNYIYSTSTEPYYAFRYGPVFKWLGLNEIPVSGTWSRPLQILDSWGYFAAPDRIYGGNEYLDEAKKVNAIIARIGLPFILNYYVDPSHVVDKEIFFATVKVWREMADSVSYSRLMEDLSVEKV